MDCFQRFLRREPEETSWTLVSGEMFQKIWFQICSLEIVQQILHLSLGYKIRPLINHFNAAFGEALSPDNKQSIDKHMTKFKRKHGCKQYLLLKPLKWGFKSWCRCSSSGYLYETDLYLGKKQEPEYNLGESVVLNLSQSLRDTYCTLYFDNFSVTQLWLESYLMMAYMALVQFD